MESINNAQIGIQADSSTRRIDIYIYNPAVGKDSGYILLPDGQIGIKELAPGERLEPFISLPFVLFSKIATGMREYQETRGIKPKDQSFNEGKLEAVEKHLADMKSITWKILKINNPQNS